MIVYKIVKLDRRYNGYGHFKWAAQPTSTLNAMGHFYATNKGINIALRCKAELWRYTKWATEAYGPSCDLDTWLYVGQGNTPWDGSRASPHWCYTEHKASILLLGDEELAYFELKFG